MTNDTLQAVNKALTMLTIGFTLGCVFTLVLALATINQINLSHNLQETPATRSGAGVLPCSY